jgi:hypothetical protein
LDLSTFRSCHRRRCSPRRSADDFPMWVVCPATSRGCCCHCRGGSHGRAWHTASPRMCRVTTMTPPRRPPPPPLSPPPLAPPAVAPPPASQRSHHLCHHRRCAEGSSSPPSRTLPPPSCACCYHWMPFYGEEGV